MDELLPVPKVPSSQEQILALMAALGQHLIPDYLKQKTGPFPMEPNAAGKVPPIANSPFETAGAGMFDLATLLTGGALKPAFTGTIKPAITGATELAMRPELPKTLQSLTAQSRKEIADKISLAQKPWKEPPVDFTTLSANPDINVFDLTGNTKYTANDNNILAGLGAGRANKTITAAPQDIMKMLQLQPESTVNIKTPHDPQPFENTISSWAKGELTAKEVQRFFKERGWTVDLRRGAYEVEAFDPSGKAHYLTP